MDDEAPRDRSPEQPADDLILALREHGIRDQAFEALPDAALVVDRGGVVADLNRHAVDLLGRSPDERVEVEQVVAAEEGVPLSEAQRRPLRVTVTRADGSTVVAVARSVAIHVGPDALTLIALTDLAEPWKHLDVIELEADRRRMEELERVATQDATKLQQRIARLQAITDAALAHLSLDQLFEELLSRLRELLDAEAATVLLVDPELRVLRVATTSGLPRGPENRLEVPLGSGVAGRIAAGRRPVIIGDLRRVRSVNPFVHNTLRSLVGVPIVNRGDVTGVLHVGSLRTRHFTEEDIALLEIVAARLAPAIENAQLHAFEREARAAAEQDARRLRLLQDVTEALATTRSARDVATAVVERLARMLETNAATIVVRADDGRSLELLAAVGVDEAAMQRWARFPLDAKTPLGDAVAGRRQILIGSRVERDTVYPDLPGSPSSAWAALPLMVDDVAIGALALSFPAERSFSEADIELFAALARQAAQAMDRARRSDAERAAAERAEATSHRIALLQSLTARFSRALTSREVAEITVSEIARSLGAPYGAFYRLDEDGMLAVEGAHGYGDDALAGWRRFPVDLATPAGDAVRTGEVVVVASPEELVTRYPAVERSLTGRPVGATVTVPVLVEDHPIGAAAFTFGAGRALEDDDIALLRALGRHSGQALERARLYETERHARREAERARERTERLQALAGELVDAGSEAEVEQLLAEHILAAAGGNASVVVRLHPDGMVHIVASRGYVRETIERDRAMHRDAASPLNDAMRSRAGVWITSSDQFAERYPLLLDDWNRTNHRSSFAALPLKVGDRVVGAVGVRVAESDAFDDDDRELLRAIARQAAQAIQQTALRSAERSVRSEVERSERRYRSLIETTSAIHWTADPAGAFVEPQPSWAAYTGQSWDEYRGFGWIDAVHTDDRDPMLERWVAARDSAQPYENATRVLHAASGDHRHVVVRAAPVREDDGRILEWVGTVTDVHDELISDAEQQERERTARDELQEASERLAYLAEASQVLAESLNMDDTLQRLTDLAVPRLADWCTLEMLDEDGDIRQVAVSHVDPSRIELARDLRRRYPPDPDSDNGTPMVLRTGRSLVMPEIPEELLEQAKQANPELADLVDELQLRSVMIVPIATKDRVLGAITFVWAESGGRYDEDDLSLAEDLARRAAVSIENARLYGAESAARREESRARERLEIIAETGEAMANTLVPRAVAETLALETAKRLADVSIAYLVDRDRRVEDFVAAHRDAVLTSMIRRAVSLQLPTAEDEHSAVGRVLAHGKPILMREIPDDYADRVNLTDEQRAAFARFGPTSEIAVPIRGRGDLLGVLGMIRTQGRQPFDDDDLELAMDLARRAGIMLENARLSAEREEVAETLQRSLLPPEPPSIPGIDVGSKYLPAAEGLTVGGDFYDVFELDFDHWGVVIGDVVGKGAAAAAVMGLARYTLRTAAMSEGRPSALLRTLNDAIVRQATETMFCTACFARVRRNEMGARVTLSLGGHPTPLLVRPDGDVREIGSPGTLLGVFEDPTLTDQVVDLEAGDALVFYTDGVTDERRGDEEFGDERLQRTLSTLGGRSAQDIVDGIVDAVVDFRSGTAHDDIALLVIRVRPVDRG
jgi:PAS domain S-box-containing protein